MVAMAARLHKKILWSACILLLLAACEQKQSGINGYVEGEYLMIAPTSGGLLATLSVDRGDQVKADQPLFSLDVTKIAADRDVAAAGLAQAAAHLSDLSKGKRPEEIDVFEKQKTQAEADLQNAEDKLNRSQPLAQKGFGTKAQRDADLAQYNKAKARVAELEAQLTAANLGGRVDEIAGAKDAVNAAKQKLAQADKLLAEAAPKAPKAGRIEDVFYRAGEFVPPGAPVVSLLPPENVKVRFFVPEKTVPLLRPGMEITVRCDGCKEPVGAKITFISNQVEYTPPVIYSVGSRDKLVFLVEARPDIFQPELRPGLPVDIELRNP